MPVISTVMIPLNPLTQYSPVWFIIACCLFAVTLSWIIFLLWHTRKRPLKSLENLRVLTDEERLVALKGRYLQLIDEGYAKYQNGHTTLRGLHRGMSMTVRYFVYEASHFPAPKLTLSDLERAPYPKLTNVIADYYHKEFATIENGDPAKAVGAAKELIQQWS